MPSFNVFAEVQKFAEAMRCASPLSSSVDIPVTSRPKVWRNEDCPTVVSSRSIDGLCDKIEERLDLGTECQETSEYSSQVMTSALTFEERCRHFDDLVYWVKDCQQRHAERQPFHDANGKLVGATPKRPRYRLDGKVHSKVFATAVESSDEDTDFSKTTVKSPVIKRTSAANKRTPTEKVFPPKNFTPLKQYTPAKKAPPAKKAIPDKKNASVNRANGYQDGVRVRDFAIYDYDTKRRSLPIRKSTSRKKMALVRWTDSSQGEVKVRDFAYDKTTDKTSEPTTTGRGRRDAFLKAG